MGRCDDERDDFSVMERRRVRREEGYLKGGRDEREEEEGAPSRV